MYIPIELEVLAIPFKTVLLRRKLVYKPPKDYFLSSRAFSPSPMQKLVIHTQPVFILEQNPACFC